MERITSKQQLKVIIEGLPLQPLPVFIDSIYEQVLKKKVRFPLLEFAAVELYGRIPETEQLNIIDKLMGLEAMGSNVIAGKILQLRLERHFNESFRKAIGYISAYTEWYVCDIIGERVAGHALLTQPEKTIPQLKQLAEHKSNMAVRCIGVAAHYAAKKGLQANHAGEVFSLLLSLSGATDHHIKTGIGWGAKTIVKFHPHIVAKFSAAIAASTVKQWFRTKVDTGLKRHEYARRNRG